MEMRTLDMQQEVSCLDLGEIGCWDDTVQLLSLDPGMLLYMYI